LDANREYRSDILESENSALIHFPASLLKIHRWQKTRARSTIQAETSRRGVMTQKVIEIVGTSKESFAKAAESAVTEAAKTVRGLKWARVADLEMELDGKKIIQYRATTKIYFDIQK